VRTSNPTYRYSDRLCHIEGNYLLWIFIPYMPGKPFHGQNMWAVKKFIPNHVWQPAGILRDCKFKVMEHRHCFTLRKTPILTGLKFITKFLKALSILGLLNINSSLHLYYL
jgi:hypothetical protein